MFLSAASFRLGRRAYFSERGDPLPSKLLRDSLHLRYHLFGDVARRGVVALEVHGRGGSALRHRAKVGRVTEHLRERDVGRDDLRAAGTRLHLLNLPATTVQV